jgi:peptidoglycan/LPS O-acetylase OafA/YrhL
MTTRKRIPGLDGLRGVLVSAIVYVHLWAKHPRFKFDLALFVMFVFFVLSGYLITKLLIEEREQTGTVSVRAFYGRRFFRIFPALFGYLCGLALMSRWGLASSSPRELLLGLTFIANYRYSGFLSLVHLWSLAVEEQFYVLWPLLFSRFSNKSLVKLLIAVICTAPLIRLWHLTHGADWVALQWHSESLADALAVGCLLAIVQPHLRNNRIYQWFSNSKFRVLIPFLAVIVSLQWSQVFSQLVGKTLTLLLIATGIDLLSQRSDSTLGKVFNSRLLVKLGTWSYSLYLWQQVFTSPDGAQPYAWFPMNVALVLVTGVSSYYVIERPLLRWGRDLILRRPTGPAIRGVAHPA